jgi:N,N'-diacetylchitobiose transport system permease protein
MSAQTQIAPAPVAPKAAVTAARRGRRRRVSRTAWNLVGILVLVVLAFPVFWMISTAFKPEDQINSFTPTWFSLHPTLG